MRLSPAAIACVLVVGCSSGPPVRHYTLHTFAGTTWGAGEEAEPNAVAAPRLGVVAPFQIESPYDHGRLVYRVAEGSARVQSYAYHQWAAPLGEELARATVEFLRPRIDSHFVELATSGRSYEAHLRGRLLVLEEIDSPQAVAARVLLELELRSPADELLWHGRLEGREVAAVETVEEVVALMRASLQSALRQAAEGLRPALPAE